MEKKELKHYSIVKVLYILYFLWILKINIQRLHIKGTGDEPSERS